ncbi:polar amino acid transport system substrate-binding protein [Variovorax sp. HW608]|uniref:amino acid ABC transporter substrate-binding protein n=1 Tax=Variovorax sp. HW608 TaxID=1034889 RepID=UPI00081FA48C|nr:amino acid ABC transporter substrate-binding protein [Variovorax sp. HW608]SCK50317.1 polar amino acid transport system substrate-binding protein [Variovorax sp. HW608]
MRSIQFRSAVLALIGAALLHAGAAFAAGTLDKLRESGKFVVGYVADGSSLTQKDATGKITGYAIALCTKVGEAAKQELKLSALAVELVQVSMEERFSAVSQGKIDMLCGAVPTLERRAEVSFSIPVGFVGVNAVIRSDAPVRLAQVLTGREPPAPVIWRGTNAPERRVLAVVGGSTVERALADKLAERRIAIDVVSVKDTTEGVQAVVDRRADAFFDGRPLLLDAVARSPAKSNLVVLDRLFRRELLALAIRRNDDDFRLTVDRALSRVYRSPELPTIYRTYLKEPDREALEFFELMALPE